MYNDENRLPEDPSTEQATPSAEVTNETTTPAPPPVDESRAALAQLPEIPRNQEPIEGLSLTLPDEMPPRRKKGGFWGKAIAVVALVALGAGVGSATTASMISRYNKQNTPIGVPQSWSSQKTTISEQIYNGSTVVSDVYKRVGPSVVSLEVRTARGGATGSGFVVDPSGYILTNHHVIEGARTIKVHFLDGTELNATLVGSDSMQDLAVVKVDPGNRTLVAAPLGDSGKVEVGELAIAIGAPFGVENTVTAGIISGLNRTLDESGGASIKGVLQTDAAINPGNSGGPLLNAKGEVIGINTAIEGPVQGNVGIGYSVPINTAKELLPELKAGNKVYPWLGVSLQDMDSNAAKVLNTDVTEGAVIVDVIEGTPAEKAGVQLPASTPRGVIVSADIIIAVDGNKVAKAQDLINYVRTKKVGDKITLEIARGKERVKITATLEARPAE
ncbi:MAG TPA: trypsin-like peptidase domain-containing protein [Symbiobacteriaceae bacterium]|nr:trypsin-like peptidase domain-containing protein [Symbiobacteriaceae bacterium]